MGEVPWKAEPHTLAKLEILRRYLGAWFSIICQRFDELVYVDATSGPGEYSGGEDGSPLVALDAPLSGSGSGTRSSSTSNTFAASWTGAPGLRDSPCSTGART